MEEIQIFQMPYFKKDYKKLHPNQKLEVNAAVKKIKENPLIGEEKRGELAGVRVYKFDCVNKLYLIAYEYNEETRTLLALGVHENFYDNLKQNLKNK